MPTLPINGAQLRVRMVEIELDRLKLDPDNPRLHTAYLTHSLPTRPSETQIIHALEALPEFEALLDAISRNHGCFQPPLITVDYRVLEGNRRITALRKLQAEDPQNQQWVKVTVHQLTTRASPEQERSLRAKFHLDYVESREFQVWERLIGRLRRFFLSPEFIALGVSRCSRKRRPQQLAAAHRSTTCRGAQVALQRCLILRAGVCDFIRIEKDIPSED